MFQLNYNKNHSFCQNCINGFKIGFLFGWAWPIIPLVAPLFAYRYIEPYIDSENDIEKLLDIVNSGSDQPTRIDVGLAEKRRMRIFKDDDRMMKGVDKRKKLADAFPDNSSE